MRRHPHPRKPRPAPAGGNPLLRRAFEREQGIPPNELERVYHIVEYQVDLHRSYYDWLRAKGIDPDTGAMTPEGLAFFKGLLDAQNARVRRRRRSG